MTLHRGHGLDWGLESAISEIISEELTPVDLERAFEECMREIYPASTTLGFLTVDTIDAMRTLDPVAWDLAQSENTDILESDELITSLDGGNTYFWTTDLERLSEAE